MSILPNLLLLVRFLQKKELKNLPPSNHILRFLLFTFKHEPHSTHAKPGTCYKEECMLVNRCQYISCSVKLAYAVQQSIASTGYLANILEIFNFDRLASTV